MGRHTAGEAAVAGNGRRTAVIIVGLLLLALLAFLIWPLITGEDDADAGDNTAPSTSTSSTTGGATSTGDEDATTDDDTASSSPTTDDAAESASESPTTEDAAPAGPPEALTACASEVAAGDQLASVAKVGAENWKAHFTASVDFNAGDITLDEANDIFNTTKVNVDQEVEDYATARTAYDEASGGCAELADADVDAEFADAAADCTARAAALSDLAATADNVTNDWAEHGTMMAAKADQDINDYMAEWHNDVASAPANMDPYDDAVAALEEAPACSVG